MMAESSLQAAKQFLRTAFRTDHGREPRSDNELADWCLIQWSQVASLAPEHQVSEATARALSLHRAKISGGAE